jgi:hypothetical protein
MGSGLGSLQREIFASLDGAKRDRHEYRGSAGEYSGWPPGHRWTLPGWVKVGRNTVRLGLNVYDLRASCAFLARRHDKLDYGTIKPSFASVFSRAAATLIKRGLLSPVESALSIADLDEDKSARRDLIHELQDGMFLMIQQKQARFVTSAVATKGGRVYRKTNIFVF